MTTQAPAAALAIYCTLRRVCGEVEALREAQVALEQRVQRQGEELVAANLESAALRDERERLRERLEASELGRRSDVAHLRGELQRAREGRR